MHNISSSQGEKLLNIPIVRSEAKLKYNDCMITVACNNPWCVCCLNLIIKLVTLLNLGPIKFDRIPQKFLMHLFTVTEHKLIRFI